MYHLPQGCRVLSSEYCLLFPHLMVWHKCFPGNGSFPVSGGIVKLFKGNHYGTDLCLFIWLTNVLNTYRGSDTMLASGIRQVN